MGEISRDWDGKEVLGNVVKSMVDRKNSGQRSSVVHGDFRP